MLSEEDIEEKTRLGLVEAERKICLAFATIPCPAPDEIGVPDGRNEAELITKILSGKHWQTVAPSELWPFGLGFMTPKAFHHYLPAYLLAEYEHGSSALEMYLTPPELANDEHASFFKFDLLFQDFNAGEKQAISAYVAYLYESAQECNTLPYLTNLDEKENQFWYSLREYWRQF